MAVTAVATSMAGAINYTFTTDTSADFSSVANSTYFYNKADKLVRYKDSTGTVLEIFSAAGGTINNGRILYVATTGVDATGAVGNMAKPYLTLEAAQTASSSGDLIYVFPGTYALTTVATSGIAKNGVSYYFEPNCVVTKATTGSIFNTTGFTTGFNVYGYATFTKTATAGTILTTSVNAFDVSFEALDVSCTNDHCFTLTLNSKTGNFKLRNATSSGGTVFNFIGVYTNNDTYNITANNLTSTSSHAIYQNQGVANLNVNANVVKSTAAVAVANMYYSYNNFNINNCVGVSYGYQTSTNNGTVINGTTNGIYQQGGPTSFNGTATRLLCTGGTFDGGSIFYPTVTGGQATFTWFGSYDNTLSVSGGVAYVTATHNNSYAAPVSVTGGKLYLTGNILGSQSYGNMVVNGATAELIFNGTFIYASTSYQPYYSAFVLTAGTLRLTGHVENKIPNNYQATCVLLNGGNLILDRVTLITATPFCPPIINPTSAKNIRVYAGGLSTNRVENGGTLVAKPREYKQTVNAVAATSITLNDGSGANEVFTESATGTYNTLALMAQRMVTLINASATLDITATQDTPGTDTYFYVAADTNSTSCTIAASTNLTSLLLVDNSYLLTDIVGGTIIENSNII